MKTILLNSMPEEVRMAIVAGGELQAIEMERASHSHLVGNLYRGRVQNVLPGMQAAFVDIGREKNAFLYIGDGMPKEAQQAVRQQKIHIGQTLPVQIVKDAIGTKGPRATTHLTLPGRNVVLMPTAAYIGISRRIESEEERARLHGIAERICPKDMGLIIRTVAAGKTEEALAADVRYLRRLWESIQARMKLGSAPSLLYRDADLAIRMVRDSFTEEIDEVIVDDRALYQRIVELVEYASPELADRVKLYAERTPLFRKYHLEEELEKLGAREVELPSGGFIVIDKTEALTVIDVNTGRFVGKANLADTVYHTNLEAAAEILKQLRLRDIGGIIVVDFIDMEQSGQKEELLAYMREHVKSDPTKTNIVDITSLGLVEITRKKSRQN
ncbi:MAG: Rne/Rng family ribonuclease, partial [Selenomonadaceae bacterium]|nr:Rne/Rng family ribonuclease [Selenomonadaceae bacterium]